MEAARKCSLLLGIMENKMETTIVNWGYIGIMENKMETTIVHWAYSKDPVVLGFRRSTTKWEVSRNR